MDHDLIPEEVSMIGMRSFGVVPGMVLALLIVLGAAGAAWLAYNACVDNDLAQSAAGEEPVRPPGYGYGFHPFGPGFGLLGCLVFQLLFFLFFLGYAHGVLALAKARKENPRAEPRTNHCARPGVAVELV